MYTSSTIVSFGYRCVADERGLHENARYSSNARSYAWRDRLRPVCSSIGGPPYLWLAVLKVVTHTNKAAIFGKEKPTAYWLAKRSDPCPPPKEVGRKQQHDQG